MNSSLLFVGGVMVGGLAMHFQMLNEQNQGFRRGPVPDVSSKGGSLKETARAQSRENMRMKQSKQPFSPHKPSDLQNSNLTSAQNFFQNTKNDEKLAAKTRNEPMKKNMFSEKNWARSRQKYVL